MSENERNVYHYLHESASGKVVAKWENWHINPPKPESKILVLELPLTFRSTTKITYQLNVDPRDQRTLVVFDGHIPWGGLPKNGTVVLEIPTLELCVPEGNIRKPNPSEETALWNIWDNGKNEATLSIDRYFILLPKSVSCVRRYDARSLRPIYTFIEVNEKGVTWRNSSY